MSTVIAGPKSKSFLTCINRFRSAHKRRHNISKADRTIILAQGKALAMLVTMLQARGHLDAEDYAGTWPVQRRRRRERSA